MKKVLFLAVAALAFVSCGNNNQNVEENVDAIDSTAVEVAPVDEALSAADSAATAAGETVVDAAKDAVNEVVDNAKDAAKETANKAVDAAKDAANKAIENATK